MLPGLRFLFGAIVLSVSVLVFGFGAAALLRTAHEEFASAPAWRPAPETRFANHEASQPVLALLRVDDGPRDTIKDAVRDVAKDAPPALNDAAAEPAASSSPQPDLDKTAALQPADAAPSEAAKPEAEPAQNQASEIPPQAEATAAPTDAPVATDQTRIATTEQPSDDAQAEIAASAAPVTTGTAPAGDTAAAPAVEAAAAAPEQASTPAPAKPGSISTRIATLGGPPVKIATNDIGAKPAPNVIRKRQAHRAAHRRHRIALRRAQQQAVQQQQQLNPFTPLPVAR